jgi:Porin PorA
MPAPPRRHRRWPIVLVVAGAVLIGGSVLWQRLAVPALVRYPTDVDQTVRLDGTATLYVDPATMSPYTTPHTMALHIDRHVFAVGSQSSHDTVVVREENTIEPAELPTMVQIHQYVMDRASISNESDPRAYAYDPANVVDRADAYWVNFPMHAGAAWYAMFKDEVGRTITTTLDPSVAAAAGEPDGLHLVGYRVAPDHGPITAAYYTALDQAVPLPQQVTLTQLDPILKANGIDVTATVNALLPVVTPEELTTLTDLATRPIGLVYSTAFSGSTAVEPRTGAIVDITAVDETIDVAPSPEALPPLVAVLDAHRDVPAVAAALAGLERLQARPITLLRYQYAQTPASVQAIAKTVNDQLGRIDLVETTIPWALGLTGVVLTVVGVVLIAIRRRLEPDRPVAAPAATEREPVSSIAG